MRAPCMACMYPAVQSDFSTTMAHVVHSRSASPVYVALTGCLPWGQGRPGGVCGQVPPFPINSARDGWSVLFAQAHGFLMLDSREFWWIYMLWNIHLWWWLGVGFLWILVDFHVVKHDLFVMKIWRNELVPSVGRRCELVSLGLLYNSVWSLLSSSLRRVSRKWTLVEEDSKVNLIVGCCEFASFWNRKRLRGEWDQMNWMSSM